MNDESRAAAVRLADRVAWVCQSATTLRNHLPDADKHLMAEVLTAVGGEDPLAVGGTLDALLDALSRIGIRPDEPPRGVLTGSGSGGAHGLFNYSESPAETVYLCPLSFCCTRAWLPEQGKSVPRCSVSGEPLWERPVR
ncbi:hypothetical protein [Streptomyces cupreus]|uniref:Uncharacterized protein n=1 Tax=Streptomyces cupreus TaxID=2759956 RepID=A0A7X1M8L6_9ACTN|nr:hypothetical protein [Streptomyces cupreus]MBC2902152.1 hypothetical protein [Streptomyces cupreus]